MLRAMGEEQPARPGPESAPPLAEAPSAAVPPRAVPRPFALRSVTPRHPPPEPAASEPPRRRCGPGDLGDRGRHVRRVRHHLAVPAGAAQPASWDLGIYTEYVKQYAYLSAPIVDIRAPGFNLLGDHFQPIVAVLAPFFRVFPSAATLLIAQALLAAVSVFPVSQLAREKLGTGPGPGDRDRVRVLLGPAADGQLRLPRDRLRRPAAGLLAVRAGPRPASRPRCGGRCRWSSSRRTRASRWPPSGST